jgi:protein-S-isoprenylcysteine O-methyltransferase Ste14
VNSSRLFNNILPAIAWTVYNLCVPIWRADFFSALMLVRSAVIVVAFLRREPPLRRAPMHQIAVSWVGTFLPVLMVWQASAGHGVQLLGEILAVCGMVLFIFACVDLDRSFGISRARRTFKTGSVYRWVRHPMYVSHLLIELGILIANPSRANFWIVACTWVTYFLRGRWEQKLIPSFGEKV